MRVPVLSLLLTFVALPTALQADCAGVRTTYIPLMSAVAPLGLHDKTRAQFMDGVYGAGQWRLGGDGDRAHADSDDGQWIVLDFRAAARRHLDLFIESEIVVRGRTPTLTPQWGHRHLARYLIAAGERARVRVPRAAFRESGALLAAVQADASIWEVYAWPLADGAGCERRIYVRDRATAVRLMRE